MPKAFHLLDRYLALKRSVSQRPGTASGVLLLSCGGLGDTVLFAMVLPRLVKLAKAGEKVTVLLRHNAAKMAFLFPSEVEVLAMNFDRLKDLSYRRDVCEDLFAANYRLVVATDYLRHPNLDEVLVEACQAPETAAMEPRPWPKYARALARNRRLYARLFDSGDVRVDKVVRWNRFADWLTGTKEPPPPVRLPEAVLPPLARADQPTVMIQPFSAVKLKQSPVALYEAIIDALPDGYRVTLLGAPGDLERNPDYEALLERPNVDFDTSTFAEIVPLLRAADLVISVDTALMHLAVAVGANTLCLASAAYVGEIVPYAAEITPDNAAFLYHPMPCEGCLGACVHPAEDGMYPCIARLERNRVLRTVLDLTPQS